MRTLHCCRILGTGAVIAASMSEPRDTRSGTIACLLRGPASVLVKQSSAAYKVPTELDPLSAQQDFAIDPAVPECLCRAAAPSESLAEEGLLLRWGCGVTGAGCAEGGVWRCALAVADRHSSSACFSAFTLCSAA